MCYQTVPTPEEMGRCNSVYLTEVGDTQVVVFKHGGFHLQVYNFAIKYLVIYVLFALHDCDIELFLLGQILYVNHVSLCDISACTRLNI